MVLRTWNLKLFSSPRCSPHNTTIINQLAANENSKPIKKRLIADYKILPNPASDLICIKGSKVNEKLQVIVYDVNERVVKTESLTLDGNNTQLKLDLINGIYFVNLVNENGFRTVKKLIIAK
ncbi:MAG: T9SS type A sorting domain-containing protein [Bacteroidia bacterium]|nr:T9SS type A sorting domain-containing protein [Bacteroidia bacterium]